MLKSKRKYLVVLGVLVSFLCINGVANATYYGTGSGSGGKPGCPKPFSTCYGATWRYYDWDDAYNGNIVGMRAVTSADVEKGIVSSDKIGDIYVYGTNSNFRAFANGTDATGETISKDCKNIGGFYRYAMVASSNYTYKSTDTGGSDGGKDAGVSVVKGVQYGFLGISSNSNPKFNSEFFRSSGQTSVNYIDVGDGYDVLPWRSVYEEFWKNKNNPSYANLYAGMEWGTGDYSDGDPATYATNLSWFCAPDKDETESIILAQSNISNSALGGYSTTGKNSGALKVKNTSRAIVDVNQAVTITFSHNLYSATPASNISWSMTETGLDSTSSYTIEPLTNSGVGMGSNPANLNVFSDGYYVAEDRPGFDGSYNYLVREQYKVTFKANGTYKFCEMIGVVNNGTTNNLTQVCTEVLVGTTSKTCGDATLGKTYQSGITDVLSRVNNDRIKSIVYGGWKNQTYAKPGDYAQWINCYFPGVQEYANKGIVELNQKIVGTHAVHSGCSCTSNEYKSFGVNTVDRFGRITKSSAYRGYYGGSRDWTNQVKLETTSPSGFNHNLVDNELLFKLPKDGEYIDYGAGDYSTRTWLNEHQINLISDVGKSFNDKIYTPGTPASVTYEEDWSHSWRACCGCGCGVYSCVCCWKDVYHCNSYNIGTFEDNEKTDESTITIPYNYENSAEMSVITPTQEDLVYSGEKITVNRISVNVGVRENSLTEGTYATIVRNARVKMIAYVSSADDSAKGVQADVGSGSEQDICSLVSKKGDECSTVADSGTTVLNSKGELLEDEKVKNFADDHGRIEKIKMNDDGSISSSNEYVNFVQNYTVFDSNAGDYYCMAIAVYPSKSGGNDNTNPNGNNKWYVSQPICKVIAKRPSLQVYGGSVYSSGSIDVEQSEAVKYHVYGSDYNKIPENSTVFDSFTEQSVLANDYVYNFASGVSTGLTSNGAGSEEGKEYNFCTYRTPLSFANYAGSVIGNIICPGAQATGKAGIVSGVIDRSSLASYWVPDDVNTAVKNGDDLSISLAEIASEDDYRVSSATGKTVRYVETDKKITLNGGAVDADTTFVIKTSGDIDINEDLTYTNDNLNSAGQIPKIVIYAGGNIKIACKVSKIDALIIAGGDVNTCDEYSSSNTKEIGRNFDEVNKIERSNRLTIRGVVISNTLTPSRTYGASRGVDNAPNGVPVSGSAAAAEVINYDTSAILWGRYMAGAGESDTLTVVYQHELAPRY